MNKRVLANDVKSHIGSEVMVEGWLHKKRLLGGLTFINVRDRSGLVQIVLQAKDEVEKLRGLQIGTVMRVTGKAVEEPRAPGGAELHEVKIEVLVPVTEEPPIEIDKPLSHKPENLDTLFDHRVIGLRNVQEATIFRLRSEILRLIRDFLYRNDFVEINTPKLVAGAAEGGAEVFKLDYFGKEATLAQSPQLYKQIMVGVFERVFEIAPAFRAELSATTRHVSEVTMLDVEMGFIEGHNEVLALLQSLIYEILTELYKEHGDELKSLHAPELKLKPEFPRYSMKQIHEMYQKETGKDTSKEIDLTPEEEKWICEYTREHEGCEAVFATGLPESKMKFYHMKGDEGTARSADLLFRGVEIATVPQREHRHENLVKQMKAAGIDPNSPGFSHFVTAFKHGLPPHGGFGFGIDRLVEKVIGLANVKEAILFPRDQPPRTMIYDLTHAINDDLPVYPGDPHVKVQQVAELDKDGYADRLLTIGTHNGTHIDAPAHMIKGGKTLKDFSIDRFVKKTICIDTQSGFDPLAIANQITEPGLAVLFYTGAEDYFNEERYWHDYLVLDDKVAQMLINKKVSLVGIDTGSFDKAEDFPIHKAFLRAEILLIENLTNLKPLAGKAFELYALPLKLETDGAPARVIAKI